MAMSDAITAVLGAGGLVSMATGLVMIIKTLQQRRVIKADVLDSLASTSTEWAESVRRDAQQQIDDARRYAQQQIEYATQRAENAERRAVEAERSALAAEIKAMEASATVRRLTSAVHSPYATIEGIRTMLPIDGPAVNGR